MSSAKGMMKSEMILTAARSRTPRTAAIAGILFSLLLISGFLLLRLALLHLSLSPTA